MHQTIPVINLKLREMAVTRNMRVPQQLKRFHRDLKKFPRKIIPFIERLFYINGIFCGGRLGYHFKSRANNKEFTNYKELNYQTILN